MNFLAQKRKKVFLQEKPVQKTVFHGSFYQQLAQLTGSGAWSVNAMEKTSYLDKQAKNILEIPEDYRPSLKHALDFYHADYHEIVQQKLFECFQGKPFCLEVKMLTYNKKHIWVKATGGPMFDANENVIGAQGVFQDISNEKQKEIQLKKSLQAIERQKESLSNFAHTVSYNLRSDINNLNLTVELLKDASTKDVPELTDGLFQIAQQLNVTMEHLNKVVISQTRDIKEKQVVALKDVLEHAKNRLAQQIVDTNTELFSEFSEVPTLECFPAYLENIFTTLLANAIKYAHPERTPVIDIYSKQEEDGSISLVFKDNGIGIDLEKNADKLFGMYQTFHNNPDAVGIGLFILKNQIESLQGTISVVSKLGSGTTFTINF